VAILIKGKASIVIAVSAFLQTPVVISSYLQYMASSSRTALLDGTRGVPENFELLFFGSIMRI
jgi:hypothetical protein